MTLSKSPEFVFTVLLLDSTEFSKLEGIDSEQVGHLLKDWDKIFVAGRDHGVGSETTLLQKLVKGDCFVHGLACAVDQAVADEELTGDLVSSMAILETFGKEDLGENGVLVCKASPGGSGELGFKRVDGHVTFSVSCFFSFGDLLDEVVDMGASERQTQLECLQLVLAEEGWHSKISVSDWSRSSVLCRLGTKISHSLD